MLLLEFCGSDHSDADWYILQIFDMFLGGDDDLLESASLRSLLRIPRRWRSKKCRWQGHARQHCSGTLELSQFASGHDFPLQSKHETNNFPSPGGSKLRHRGIALQHGSERALERPEVCLVVAPVFNAVAKNGLADLLGAGRPDRALVFIKSQTLLLKGHAAIAEQSAHFRFGIFDQRFVNDSMHAARQHRIEV